MKILLNEQEINCPFQSFFEVKDHFYPGSDVWIYNGFPLKEDCQLKEGDHLFFIQRGQVPSQEAMEKALVSRHTPGVHEKIKDTSVAICGLGGLGSNIAIMLARLGFKKLVLIDFDLVEPSNLNRQQYFVGQLGMQKTQALKEILADVNPYMTIETHDVFIESQDVKTLLSQVDIIVEAFDSPASKAMLVSTVLSQLPETYIVAASGLAGYGSSNTIISKRVKNKFYLVGDDVSGAEPGAGLMAPRATLAAAHQANMVLRLAMGIEEV